MTKLTPNFALLDAVRRGSVSDIRTAMERGADVQCRTIDGKTVLQQAMRHSQRELVDFLVAQGADPNQTIGPRADTLLHKSSRSGDIGFTMALLRNGADPNLKNTLGQTPLYVAAREGNEYLARALLDAEARPDIAANNGKLPEAIALQSAHTHLAKLLLEKRLAAGRMATTWGQRVATEDTGYGVSDRSL